MEDPFTQAAAAVGKTLDKLVFQFKKTASEFYGKHQAARRIVDTSARKKGTPTGTPPTPA